MSNSLPIPLPSSSTEQGNQCEVQFSFVTSMTWGAGVAVPFAGGRGIRVAVGFGVVAGFWVVAGFCVVVVVVVVFGAVVEGVGGWVVTGAGVEALTGELLLPLLLAGGVVGEEPVGTWRFTRNNRASSRLWISVWKSWWSPATEYSTWKSVNTHTHMGWNIQL